MAAWELFFVALASLVAVLLVLTQLSTRMLQSTLDSTSTETAAGHPPASTANSRNGVDVDRSSSTDETEVSTPRTDDASLPMSTPALWANVVLTQGLFGLLLVVTAWYTGVPAAAFGAVVDHSVLVSAGLAASIPAGLAASMPAGLAASVVIGLGVGVVFFGLSELSTRAVGQFGVEPPTALREALAAETPGGWAVLLGVVLPVIAVVEELLFRGAMIGALSVGLDVPVWLLVVGSSVAFGLGHSAQGRVGMVVTGLLGVGLGGVFVWTENLLVVIVAHYVINAAEFIVHEAS